MTSLATAKILFFIAITLGPHSAHSVYATSNTDNYLWTSGSGGWELKSNVMPCRDWRYEGQAQAPQADDDSTRAISQYHWHDGALLDLANGNQVKFQNDTAFYIVDPGAANQKVYTILYPQE